MFEGFALDDIAVAGLDGGHHMAEEAPSDLAAALEAFLSRRG